MLPPCSPNSAPDLWNELQQNGNRSTPEARHPQPGSAGVHADSHQFLAPGQAAYPQAHDMVGLPRTQQTLPQPQLTLPGGVHYGQEPTAHQLFIQQAHAQANQLQLAQMQQGQLNYTQLAHLQQQHQQQQQQGHFTDAMTANVMSSLGAQQEFVGAGVVHPGATPACTRHSAVQGQPTVHFVLTSYPLCCGARSSAACA